MKRSPEEAARRRDIKKAVANKKLMEAFRSTPPCMFHRTARKRLFG